MFEDKIGETRCIDSDFIDKHVRKEAAIREISSLKQILDLPLFTDHTHTPYTPTER